MAFAFQFTTLRAVCVACMTLAASAAHADFANNITVQLLAPGGVLGDASPLSFTQVASVSAGIKARDGGDIGTYMLDGELIRFSGNSILIHVAAGNQDGSNNLVTGYLGLGGSHARYSFSDLNISGQIITGFKVYGFDGFGTTGTNIGVSTPDANSLNSLVSLTSSNSLNFNLDSMIFKARGSDPTAAYGEFRIDLQTAAAPVPEPSSALMSLVGLSMFGLWARRRRASTC